MWHLIYDAVNGRLVSECDTLPDAAALTLRGLAVRSLPARPTPAEMWDEATRRTVARPPKVIRDRISDAMADSDFTSLSGAQRARLATWLVRYFDEVRNK